MQLPTELSNAIQHVTAQFSASELTSAASELTNAYRGVRRSPPQLDEIHRAAYLLTRLPATYAVLTRIMAECKLRIPELQVENMLDLGSGPGTALWAAVEHFPELKKATLLDESQRWSELGRQLALDSAHHALRSADWRLGSVVDELPQGDFDLVVASYVLNEIPAERRQAVALSAWKRASNLLLIVEPGTPEGFRNVREARAALLSSGAHVAAPCPHEIECPMAAGNWCHFAARLARSTEHRLLKRADLGYEDEKFSYVVFSRRAVTLPAARILRHPLKHSGHVQLDLCRIDGQQTQTVSRKHGDRYKQARKAEWGDQF